MTDIDAGIAESTPRPRKSALITVGCFLLASGASSVALEALWVRYFSLLIGSTTLSVSTVLSVFLGGLCLGSWLAARLCARLKHPLVAYGMAELGVGVAAIFFIPVCEAVAKPIYFGLGHRLELGAGGYGLLSLLLCVVTVGPPTVLMGMTLPFASQAVVPEGPMRGRGVGILYAANTLGAVAGAGAASLWLLPMLGMMATVQCFGITSAATGLAAILAWRTGLIRPLSASLSAAVDSSAETALSADSPTEASRRRFYGMSAETPSFADSPTRPNRFLFGLVLATGFVTLCFEVSWTRELILYLGSDTYTFSGVLATFLLGLAIGSFIASGLARPSADRAGLLMTSLFATGLTGWASLWMLEFCPYLYIRAAGVFEPSTTMTASLIKAGIAGAVVLIPGITMGMSFPLVISLANPGRRPLGSLVGRLYAWNTVGTVAGSLLATWYLIPKWGAPVLILLASLGALGLAALVLLRLGGSPLRGRLIQLAMVAAAMVTLAPPSRIEFRMAGIAQDLPVYRNTGWHELRASLLESPSKVHFHEEGLTTSVTVLEHADSNTLVLKTNGRGDASVPVDPSMPSAADMATQVALAHLPCLVHHDPKAVLIIGLGGGATLGAAQQHGSLTSIACVELEGAVARAARLFDKVTEVDWDDPRLEGGGVLVQDGRAFLQSHARRFDVIISQPSDPVLVGASNLFTAEFFSLCASRLEPGGVMCAWIKLYRVRPDDLLSVIAGFHRAFPSMYVYQPKSSQEVLLLGSRDSIPLDLHRLEAALAPSAAAPGDQPDADVHRASDAVRRSLHQWLAVHNTYDLLAQFIMGPREVEQLLSQSTVVLNTDDKPFIELRGEEIARPFGERAAENFALLERNARGPLEYLMGYESPGARHDGIAGARLRASLALAMQRYGHETLAANYLDEALKTFDGWSPAGPREHESDGEPIEKYVDLGVTLGDAMTALDRRQEALSIWDRLHESFPQTPLPALRLAQISRMRNDAPDVVIAYADEAMARAEAEWDVCPPVDSPGETDSHGVFLAACTLKISVLLDTRQFDAAASTVEYCEGLVPPEEQSPEFAFVQAKTYHYTGRTAEAGSPAARFVAARPFDPRGRFLLGQIYESLGYHGEAHEQWMLGAELARSATRSYFQAAAYQYYRRNNIPRAVDYLEEAVGLNPLDGESWALLGRCHLELGKGDRGIETLLRGLKLRPDLLSSVFEYALTLADQPNRRDEAVNIVQAVQQQRPEDSTGNYYLARILLMRATTDDVRLAQRAAALGLERARQTRGRDIARLHFLLSAIAARLNLPQQVELHIAGGMDNCTVQEREWWSSRVDVLRRGGLPKE